MSPLSSSVRIYDTIQPPTHRNPSNHIPAHNKDCVIMSQFIRSHDNELQITALMQSIGEDKQAGHRGIEEMVAVC
jgi:hypothetical protein